MSYASFSHLPSADCTGIIRTPKGMEEVNILANSCEKVWRPERTLLDSCVCSWACGCRSI